MKEKKLLTICVPAYNVESYIEKNLKSYMTSFVRENLEVLIVNDGSSDNTRMLGEKYEKQFPETYRVINKDNGGHGSTINIGIKEAKGKYFKVVDGDDWLSEENLEMFLKELSERDDDAIITNYKTINKVTNEENFFVYKGLISGNVYTVNDLLKKKIRICMAATCYKTDMLQKNKIHLLEKTYYVDEQFNVQPFLFISSIYYVDTILYCYLVGNQEQSMAIENQLRNINHRVAVIKENISFCNSNLANMGNYEYCLRKIYGEVGGVYTICLINNPNRHYGRTTARKIKQEIKQLHRGVYKTTLKRYFYPLLFLNLSYIGQVLYKKIKNY